MSPLKRPIGALIFLLFSVAATGCNGCETFVAALSGKQEGAKLTGVPNAARDGEEFTADVSGSQIGKGTVCPDIVRFYVQDLQVASIKEPPIVRTATGCRLADNVTQKVKMVDSVSHLVQVAVVVQGTPGQGRNKDVKQTEGMAPYAEVIKDVRLDNSAPASGPAPQTQTPVATGDPRPVFFVHDLPAVAGKDIALDARESWDRETKVGQYEWDYDGDGTYDYSSTTPYASIPGGNVVEGTRKIVLRVHDTEGNGAVSAPLEVTTIASTTFTQGFVQTPTEVAVNTAFDVTVWPVPGATEARLDTDDDGFYDDAGPLVPSLTPFSVPGYARGGYQRIKAFYTDGTHATIATSLVLITPYAYPDRSLAARAAAKQAKGTPVKATLKASASIVSTGKPSLTTTGVASKGFTVRGKLNGKVAPAKKGGKVPVGVKVLAKAKFAGRFDGAVPQLPGGLGLPTGNGVLLAQAPKDKKTQLCLRVSQPSATATKFTVIGATGKAKGLSASGAFPALRFDTPETSAQLAFTAKTGKGKALPAACKALVKSLGR